jgi:SsrA-binding protein
MKIINKKAKFNFEFLEKEIAGIVLKGTEIKSIRDNKVNFNDSFCYFKDNELWIKNLNISEYFNGNLNNHEPTRERKLLLTKKQLERFKSKLEEKGLTIVPTEIFINDKGFAKIEIALSRGKKTYDKKQVIKENDIKKEMDRELKKYKF